LVEDVIGSPVEDGDDDEPSSQIERPPEVRVVRGRVGYLWGQYIIRLIHFIRRPES